MKRKVNLEGDVEDDEIGKGHLHEDDLNKPVRARDIIEKAKERKKKKDSKDGQED